MTMRERLIELLNNAPPEYEKGVEGVADYLIRHGVIVKPYGVYVAQHSRESLWKLLVRGER